MRNAKQGNDLNLTHRYMSEEDSLSCITRIPSHFVHAILLSAVYSKFNRACPTALNYVQNMSRPVRSKERVSYIVLNNLSSADIEPVSNDKTKYKTGPNHIKWRDLSAIGNRRIRRHELIYVTAM